MTTQQVKLVKDSFEKILPISQLTGELFYQQLFTQAPETKRLFKNDIRLQSAKLMQTLEYIVVNLANPDNIIAEVQQLAIRHIAYGVEEAHYTILGRCLLVTLEEALGTYWSDDLHEAWSATYKLISNAMVEVLYR
jgi:hemoglobin-like flavoprotein